MEKNDSYPWTGYPTPQCFVVDLSPAGPVMGSYYIPDIGPARADPFVKSKW